MWFHDEEPGTVGLLESWENAHPGETLRLEYPDGECYLVVFETAAESDNCWEVDQGIAAEADDYYEIYYSVVEVLSRGVRFPPGSELIAVNYRDFPERVLLPDGTVLYPPS
jgi:hypothetical protein